MNVKSIVSASRSLFRSHQFLPLSLGGVQFLHLGVGRFERVQFCLTDIGEGVKEVTIKEWFVKPGDKVAQFDDVCEVQADKASVTITSRFDGVVAKLHFQTEQVAQTGDSLVEIETNDNHSKGLKINKINYDVAPTCTVPQLSAFSSGLSLSEAASTPFTPFKGKVLATPAVRRIARELEINLGLVRGSGKDGRVFKDDITNFLKARDNKEDLKSPISIYLNNSFKGLLLSILMTAIALLYFA